MIEINSNEVDDILGSHLLIYKGKLHLTNSDMKLMPNRISIKQIQFKRK